MDSSETILIVLVLMPMHDAHADTYMTQIQPLSAYGMTVPMREVIGRALSLTARPLRALLATRTWTSRVRAPLKRLAALDSSPHSPATVLIAHLRKHTPEHM